MRRLGHAQVQKRHAIKPELLGQSLRTGDQLRPRFDAVNVPLAKRLEKQVVNNEAQIRLTRPVVGQGEAGLTGLEFAQGFLDEPKQVVDLLELAARVLVELALAGEDVQGFEQLDGLARAQHLGQLVFGLRGWAFGFGSG